MAILKFILTILLFYYLFKILGRMLAPYIAKKMANKMEDMVRSQQAKDERSSGKVGETVIDKQPNATKTTSKKDVGEYIDFEEIN